MSRDIHRQTGPHGPYSLTGGYFEHQEYQRNLELSFHGLARHQIDAHLPAGSVDRATDAPDSER